MRKATAIVLACLLLVGTASAQKHKAGRTHGLKKVAVTAGGLPAGASTAMQAVEADHIRADVRLLSSDLLEGRGTGARGGDLAAEYIGTQFALAGLKPMGDNGTYLQKVPMSGITTVDGTRLTIKTPKQTLDLKQLDDAVITDESGEKLSDVSSDLLFIGYGITAPEYNWNDYAGVDVKGKVLLMLVNEPPSTDEKFFKGKALTYYGRWTYKYEHAAQMGAAGVILIHKTNMASYGWDVVRSSWSGERSALANDPNPKLHLAAWMQLEIARKMLADAGQDLDALFKAAATPGFRPIPLGIHADAHIVSQVRHFNASNVIGMVEGSDPTLKQQAVVMTAHYDHLGIRPDMPGDNIYNGALDNATGSAMIIEMARAAAISPVKPKRSLIFAAVTGEEQGLLGSEYLGQHPPVSARNISLNLNFDSIAPLGIPKETGAGGYDRTDFKAIFDKTAADFGLKVMPPGGGESGGYYRSDHFSFARVGVPAFSVNTGGSFEGHSEAWVKEHREKMGKSYHQPTDEFMADGDYRANAVIARFGLALAWKAADLAKEVEWMPGDEFEARRKAQQ